MANTKVHVGDLVKARLKSVFAEHLKILARNRAWASGDPIKEAQIKKEQKAALGLVISARRERGAEICGRGGYRGKKPYKRMALVIRVAWISGPLAGQTENHYTHDLYILSSADRKKEKCPVT